MSAARTTSFYPGPSRVDDRIPAYVRDAFTLGILSMNHRSPEFIAMSKKTVALLKQKLKIPKDYSIYFTSSATEGWEVLAQSLVVRESVHLYNGSFGEKWFNYAHKLKPGSKSMVFDRETLPDPASTLLKSGEIICLTQNETSNGTQLSNDFIRAVQKNNPDQLIAVDAVSSMAGILLDFAAGDIWIASVQKCFGMPAGLGLMILSPKAVARIKNIKENLHYNSLTLMAQMMELWQTPYTPNVMAIYLLMRTLQDRPGIRRVHAQTKRRFSAWESFFRRSKKLRLVIDNKSLRSYTVLAIQSDPQQMLNIKAAARKDGFLLGEGYGELKKETFRIANFPAIRDSEIKGLMAVLRKFL